MAQRIARRHDAIRAVTSPLPGSVPYDNVRPISVPLRLDGSEVLDFFDAMQTHLSREQWRDACIRGHIVCRGEVVTPGRVVRAGDRLLHTMPATTEPTVNADIRIVHEDDAIVVIHKPAPLPMHPCGRFSRNTLSYILEQVYHPLHLRPVHRLDADTSGLVLFAKTRAVARSLQEQQERGSIQKRYHATVIGSPKADEFECSLPLSGDPGPQGSRELSHDGPPALTRFRVLDRYADGSTLLEAEPVTGRTNQIRLHLRALSLPIIGDTFYGSDRSAEGFTGSPKDAPLMLRAVSIEFDHPTQPRRMRFDQP